MVDGLAWAHVLEVSCVAGRLDTHTFAIGVAFLLQGFLYVRQAPGMGCSRPGGEVVVVHKPASPFYLGSGEDSTVPHLPQSWPAGIRPLGTARRPSSQSRSFRLGLEAAPLSVLPGAW